MLFSFLPELHAATVGYWRFENGALTQDSGPNGYHLSSLETAGTQVTLSTTGAGSSFLKQMPQSGLPNGGAVSFSSNGAYVANHPGGNALWQDNTFTAEAFINFNSTANLKSVVGQLHNSMGRRWLLMVNGDDLSLLINANNGSSETNILAGMSEMLNLKANTDYYVAVSVDATNPNAAERVTFYLQDMTNGSPLLSSKVTLSDSYLNFSPSTAPISIGATSNPSSPFMGLIDEVRISSEALKPFELLVAPEPGRALLVIGAAAVWVRRRTRSV